MNFDQELQLTVTAADCNVLLQLLSEAPYRVAAPLVDKIRHQILAAHPTAFSGEPQVQPNGAIAGEH